MNPRIDPGNSYSPWNVWVCVATGGTGGASVGTAGYPTNGDVTNGLVEHAPVCLPTSPSACDIQLWAGAKQLPADAGTGRKACVVAGVTSPIETCVSVGVTPGTTSVTPSTGEPATGAICGASVNGSCVVKQATVTTGGTAATVYVGSSPTAVNVPTACVGLNRPNLAVVSISQSGSC